jgi:formylglycine-generating enzyme required for sulfatase activity
MSVRNAPAHKRKVIAVSLVGGLLAPSIAIALSFNTGWPRPALPELVRLEVGEILYQRAGDFTRSGKEVESPRVRFALPEPIEIMKYQVTSADYRRCVDDGMCHPLEARFSVLSADRPAVDLSWQDANEYAGWLSWKSGEVFRLPTDEEWIFAAGEKIIADERYDRGAQDHGPSSSLPAYYAFSPKMFALGTFGSNRNGLFDIAGNVWEWTSTCLIRSELNGDASTIAESTNCGVRVAEGRHRAYITDIVRDPRASGCTGIPPTHLGFRLVREQRSSGNWIGNIRRFLLAVPGFSNEAKPG